MQVRHLTLKDFRNYSDAELAFAPGMNVLVGRNGQGKTNIVESIMYLSTLRSHRTAQDAALIRSEQDAAIIRCKLAQGEREALLELQLNRNAANRTLLNRHSVRPRELRQVISAILFAPEDLNIVRGEPAVRRRFLDDALISRHPVAAGAIGDYERVLKQRNTLLRDAKHSRNSRGLDDMLDVWDDQLVTLGAQIMAHRRLFVQDVTEPLVAGYRALVAEDHRPRISLQESVPQALGVSRETSPGAEEQLSVSRETLASDMRQALHMVRAKELERGQTLVGPHRDDVVLGLNSLPVKGYASHGETWSFVLALKLALAQVLRAESTTGDPILVLDDVFAELDTGRRQALFDAVKPFEQVIVTAAVEGDVPGEGQWHTIRIHGGRVVSTDGDAAGEGGPHE